MSKIRTVTDASMASPEELREFLKLENITFTDGALKPELVALARAHISERSAKGNAIPPAPKEPEVAPDADGALRLLQAKGFKDVAEVNAYLAVIRRDLEELDRRKQALEERSAELDRRDFEMKGREDAVVKQAAAVRADIAVQTDIYEKLLKLRTQMRQEGSLADANP